MEAAELFTELLWGSGAAFGHIALVIALLFLQTRGSLGKFTSFLGGMIMFFQVLTTMSGTSDFMLFSIVYVTVAVLPLFGRFLK